MSAAIPNLRLAVCLFPGVTALDYQGPMELFGFLAPAKVSDLQHLDRFKKLPSCTISAEYIAYTHEPIQPSSGPQILPTQTYRECIDADDRFDIVLVPGGPGTRPEQMAKFGPDLFNFLRMQASHVQYLLSVCTGSWILAQAGLLNGKRATTNKAAFKAQQAQTANQGITWVPRARWVTDDYSSAGDKKLWTSSGVTAGLDLASAFLEHLLDDAEYVEILRAVIELKHHEEGDDEFAERWGLI